MEDSEMRYLMALLLALQIVLIIIQICHHWKRHRFVAIIECITLGVALTAYIAVINLIIYFG